MVKHRLTITVPPTPNGVWQATGGGTWNNAANWSNGVIAGGQGSSVVFATATAASSITLDGHFSAGSITFNSNFPYSIDPGTGGILTLDNGTSQATITNYSGTQTISAPIVLASNTLVTASSHGASVVLSGNINGSGGLSTFDQGGGGSQFSPSLVILTGSNTYTGGTTVAGGNLQLGSATALPADSALTLSAVDVPAGVLDLNGYSASVSSLTVTTGPNTQGLGAVGRIINTNTSAGVAVLTYAGSNANPSTFPGIISDSNSSGGSVTSLVMVSGSLNLTNANTYAGATNVSGGTLTLGAANALPTGTNLIIGATATVVSANLGTENAVVLGSLTNAGKLDLNNNALDIHTATASAVNAMLVSGYNHAGWNGTSGIISTAAATNTAHLTALGMIVNDNRSGTPLYGATGTIAATFDGATPVDGDILVKYTYYGDADLSGTVDGSDYSRIDNGSLLHLTGWFNGDFNYDGVINGSDYTLIDNSFNTQGASLAAGIAGPSAAATAQIAGASASVPEPTAIALLGLGAAGLLGRRRR